MARCALGKYIPTHEQSMCTAEHGCHAQESQWQRWHSLFLCQEPSAQFMLVSSHSRNLVTFPSGMAVSSRPGLTSSQIQCKHFITRTPKTEILPKQLLCHQVALCRLFGQIFQINATDVFAHFEVAKWSPSQGPVLGSQSQKVQAALGRAGRQRPLYQVLRGISCPSPFPVAIQGTDTLGVRATQGPTLP